MSYSRHFNPTQTPQSEVADPRQVKNNAGGFTFALDKWRRLDRWLILGAEGGTYYVSEKALTRDNAKTVLECLSEDGRRAVTRIAEISKAGRAPKNEPAIFALALAAADPDPITRAAALAALPDVCRFSTALFHFVRDVQQFRGWGKRLREAVATWYTRMDAEDLAYQCLKYQSRDGFSHRDVLRLAHPQPKTLEQAAVFRWATGGVAALEARTVRRGERQEKQKDLVDHLPGLLGKYELLKASADLKVTCQLIRDQEYTHEMVPNDSKKSPAVWEALLEKMPITAAIRNLAKMTAVGIFAPFSQNTRRVTAMLSDVEILKRGRVHPLTLLNAMRIYQQGHGEKGSLTWPPVREIVDALDAAFYLSFGAVEPSNKKHLLAVDVSGSMDGSKIAGTSLTAREAAAALVLVTMAIEPLCHVVAFTASPGSRGRFYGEKDELSVMNISPRMRLDDLIKGMRQMPMGRTDCALPMRYALETRLDVDIIHILTDNETWAGSIHPHQALRAYRQAVQPSCRLAVVGMTSTGFTIADPSDAGSLDVVGFDTATPALLADFARGA